MMGMSALGQLALAEVEEGAATTALYGFDRSFSLPVRYPPRLRTALNPAFFAPERAPDTSISWFAPLSEPKRFPRALLPATQPFYVAEEPEPEGDELAWFAPLSQPYLVAKSVADNPFLAFQSETPPPPFGIPWYEQFSEPQRFPSALRPSAQPFYVAEEPEPEGDELAWFAPLSEPKRFKPALEAANNPAFTRGTAPFYQPRAQSYVIC